VARLCTLRGVGRWTAEYVLLRGLGRLHVFPGDDVGARNNLQRWLGILEPLDYDGVQRVLARWQPFQGLVYLHLLLWGLQPEHGRPARGCADSATGCCAERAIEKEFSP
jgi:DNA-3-methyladenine glycosylase II